MTGYIFLEFLSGIVTCVMFYNCLGNTVFHLFTIGGVQPQKTQHYHGIPILGLLGFFGLIRFLLDFFEEIKKF